MSTTTEKLNTTTLLGKTLADSYILLLKTHNYHWNVTGPNFFSLHSMFETQYNDLFAAVDDIAERIRALDSLAPGSFAEFKKMSVIEEGDSTKSSKEMLADLQQSNEQIVETLKSLRDAAADADDKETEDMAIARIQVHQKNAWMLKVTNE